NGTGSLDVNDHPELHVDEIVVGVSEECRPLVSPGPLGSRIGRRDELGDNLTGRAPCRIVEGRQILLHRAARPCRITIPAPILTRDRTLLVGIGLDQARIEAKPSPPTRPAAMQASTTRSNTRRKTSPSRK